MQNNPAKKSPRLTLRGRLLLFFSAFIAALLLQLYLGFFQSSYVLAQINRQTGNFHAISQFLSGVEASLTTMEEYRWDYGDTYDFVQSLQKSMTASTDWLDRIDNDTGTASEEQYLLASATRTTYASYRQIVSGILSEVQIGDPGTALTLFDTEGAPCGSYVRQYAQQLLELSIADGREHYASLTALNDMLTAVQGVTFALCVVLGILTLRSVVHVLTPVQQMSVASQAISRGEYDAADVPVRRDDEIGRLAGAFNNMKRSMAEQVKTLQEKNEIQRELYQKENEALELQNLMERETLQQLRSQVNPHFLFNTLNVILHTAGGERAYRTQALIQALSHLLRYSLESNDVLVPLSREVRIIDEYFSLYHVRFGDRVRLDWRISEELDLTETMCPSFILQPLVENAFKHGILPREEGGRVRIRINRLAAKQQLFITVSDNGLGMDKATLAGLRANLRNPPVGPVGGEHIGVYNVASRLRLIDERCRFDIHSREGRGTCVVMYLPLVETPEPDENEEE